MLKKMALVLATLMILSANPMRDVPQPTCGPCSSDVPQPTCGPCSSDVPQPTCGPCSS